MIQRCSIYRPTELDVGYDASRLDEKAKLFPPTTVFVVFPNDRLAPLDVTSSSMMSAADVGRVSHQGERRQCTWVNLTSVAKPTVLNKNEVKLHLYLVLRLSSWVDPRSVQRLRFQVFSGERLHSLMRVGKRVLGLATESNVYSAANCLACARIRGASLGYSSIEPWPVYVITLTPI